MDVDEELSMKNRKFYVGIYEIDLTIYKTGNMLIVYKNKTNDETEIVYLKNPFMLKYFKKGSNIPDATYIT